MQLSHWFAMLDTEEIVSLGQHEDFNAADEELERRRIGNSIWLFTDNSLRGLRNSIDDAFATAFGPFLG